MMTRTRLVRGFHGTILDDALEMEQHRFVEREWGAGMSGRLRH
jgi:hypothetical protein